MSWSLNRTVTFILVVCLLYAITVTNCIKIGSGLIKIKQPVTALTTSPTTSTLTPTTTTITPSPPTTSQRNTSNSIIETGVGCGTKYLKKGQVVRIQSNNFNISNYPDDSACTWKFIAKECTITAECPCVDIVPSFDCIEDYLKIIDPPFYHQKFCGSTQPYGAYRASTELLSIRFRSNKRHGARGFICYVQCTPPGIADQVTPNKTQICSNWDTIN